MAEVPFLSPEVMIPTSTSLSFCFFDPRERPWDLKVPIWCRGQYGINVGMCQNPVILSNSCARPYRFSFWSQPLAIHGMDSTNKLTPFFGQSISRYTLVHLFGQRQIEARNRGNTDPTLASPGATIPIKSYHFHTDKNAAGV